jgi:hypothetical protein
MNPPRTPADLPPEWRARYEERAAIMEFDGGQTRDRAEAAAFQDILRVMARGES